MKDIHRILEEELKTMILVCEDIYKHPELGFKEFRTRQKVIDVLDKAGIAHEDCAYTGILAQIDSGKKGPHIALICELDAVPTLNHPYANSEDHAAHTCGHYAQIGVMLSVFTALKKAETLQDFCGKVTLVVTPAEEFCDMDYRKSLIREGKITHPSGKQEMISLGVFDDVDIVLSCHAMGLDMETYHAEIGAGLNGFIQKRAVFYGKAAHAGSNPAGGVNALNAANLAMTGINFLRETFREEDAIRVHFVMSEGGQTVNTVPSRTQMDMYVRAKTVDAIFETNAKVERALKAGAYAIGCDLEIQDTPGYFPLHQDPNLTDLMREHILKYMEPEKIAQGTHGYASGDMGDISMMWPTVEIGVAGFSGTMHGVDFKTADEEQAYKVPAHYFADAIMDLLANDGEKAFRIKADFSPVMCKDDYLATLDNLNKTNIYQKETGIL
ncbi:amidohydrolase [Anaerotignum sp.]|uniref:amidohydrolase n=1 Tax=Anaerotignum sp. TaxID=2039241 RepID=UPI002A91CCC3|nr:amidohydrolase [Anaerotignum sp.]MCI7656644.1 amidohydrolase [Clostridia bacterium]MDY5414142.1 amidohydrolase [Anaerotignum sp.]